MINKKTFLVLSVIAIFGGLILFALQQSKPEGIASAVETKISSTDPGVQGVILSEQDYASTPVQTGVSEILEEQEEENYLNAIDNLLVVTVTVETQVRAATRPIIDDKLLGQARVSPIAAAEIAQQSSSDVIQKNSTAVETANNGNSDISQQIAAAEQRLNELLDTVPPLAQTETPVAQNIAVLSPVAQGGAPLANSVTEFSPPPAKIVLFEGAIINGVLETALNSELPGNVRARVLRDVFDSISQYHIIIPQGSILIGEYAAGGQAGQQRAFMAFRRMILPDGRSVELSSPATDRLGAAGVPANVDNRFWEIFGTSLFVGAVGFAAGSAQTTTDDGSEQNLQGEAAGIFSDTLKDVRNSRSGYQPILTVNPGERINIFLTQDIAINDKEVASR